MTILQRHFGASTLLFSRPIFSKSTEVGNTADDGALYAVANFDQDGNEIKTMLRFETGQNVQSVGVVFHNTQSQDVVLSVFFGSGLPGGNVVFFAFDGVVNWDAQIAMSVVTNVAAPPADATYAQVPVEQNLDFLVPADSSVYIGFDNFVRGEQPDRILNLIGIIRAASYVESASATPEVPPLPPAKKADILPDPVPAESDLNVQIKNVVMQSARHLLTAAGVPVDRQDEVLEAMSADVLEVDDEGFPIDPTDEDFDEDDEVLDPDDAPPAHSVEQDMSAEISAGKSEKDKPLKKNKKKDKARAQKKDKPLKDKEKTVSEESSEVELPPDDQ